jgi:cellulose synthase/poly-beta-1,6-N-acetylglucosamine synthase-like glycosyltransferase
LTPADVEIVFVDWGSEESIIPLISPDEKVGFIRYIIVPPDITALSDPPETKFDFVQSINAGLVRAHGEQIIHADFDVFMDRESMGKLWEYLKDPDSAKYQHYFTRYVLDQVHYGNHLTDYNADFTPVIKHILDPIVDQPDLFNGGSNAVMAHRVAWHEVGGYNSALKYWGAQDVELFTRFHKAGYTGRDLCKSHGVKLVHMEHSRLSCVNTNNPGHDLRNAKSGINPNGINWGLSDYTFEEIVV